MNTLIISSRKQGIQTYLQDVPASMQSSLLQDTDVVNIAEVASNPSSSTHCYRMTCQAVTLVDFEGSALIVNENNVNSVDDPGHMLSDNTGDCRHTDSEILSGQCQPTGYKLEIDEDTNQPIVLEYTCPMLQCALPANISGTPILQGDLRANAQWYQPNALTGISTWLGDTPTITCYSNRCPVINIVTLTEFKIHCRLEPDKQACIFSPLINITDESTTANTRARDRCGAIPQGQACRPKVDGHRCPVLQCKEAPNDDLSVREWADHPDLYKQWNSATSAYEYRLVCEMTAAPTTAPTKGFALAQVTIDEMGFDDYLLGLHVVLIPI